MKAAKPLILLFGALGLVSLFLPMDPLPSLFSMLMEVDKFQLILMLAAFGIPTAVAVMALSKPPAQSWQAFAALGGFGLAAVKTHIWETLPHIMDVPLGMKLMIVATAGGVVAAIMGVVKPEDRA